MKNIDSYPFDSHFLTGTHIHEHYTIQETPSLVGRPTLLTLSLEKMLIPNNVAIMLSALHIILCFTSCGELLKMDVKEEVVLEPGREGVHVS